MAKKLYGTDPDQVPTNADLGTIAYQDSENVNLVKDSGAALTINRKTDDGDLALFLKDGSTVGSIGTSVGDLIIGTGDTGLYFYDGATSVIPWKISTNAVSDGYSDLGHPSYRWKDLYLSGDVITGGGGTGATGEIQFVADSTRARIVGGYNSGGGGYIAFRTDTSGGTDLERARFNNAGNLAFTNGYGIDFSASQGSDASSSILDDYEEGTWTPVIQGSTTNGSYTYTNGYGYYEKIGRQVTIYFSCTNITEVSAGSGYIQISGAPYAKSSGHIAIGSVDLSNLDWAASGTCANLQFISGSATSVLYVRINGDNYVGQDLQIGALSSGTSDISGTITYID